MNGLSVAWHLAERGADVVVLDKGRVGGGASGIAGGIVRNYYRSEAITGLVRMSVEMFEEEPDAYGFRQVGYMAAVPERQVEDLVAIREQHERAGYESELVTGAAACREYLTWSWPDWEAPVEAVLHERRGGWADAMQTVRHLAARARAAGAEIREDVRSPASSPAWCTPAKVGGVRDGGGLSRPVGRADWELLGLTPTVEVDGHPRPLVTYIKAQEGEFALEGAGLSGSAGAEAPVVHLDQAGPLRSDRDGSVLVDGPGASTSGWAGPAPASPAAACPSTSTARRSTRTGPTTPSTRPSPRSRTSSSPAWPRRCGASAGARATGA